MPKRKRGVDIEDISDLRLVEYCRSKPDELVAYINESWARACGMIIDATQIDDTEKMMAVSRMSQGRKAALEDLIYHMAGECRKADEGTI
jgi:hypothetical protein